MKNQDRITLWRRLAPLEPRPPKLVLWDEAPAYAAPRGSLLLTLICAAAAAALLVALVGNWQVPIDRVLP